MLCAIFTGQEYFCYVAALNRWLQAQRVIYWILNVSQMTCVFAHAVIQRAGCSTCREPHYRTIAAHTGADAAGLHRGDILATMPDGRLLALDAVVTHSWAASYADGASKTNGHAAAGSARVKCAAFARIGEGAGEDEFVPLSVEPGGRIDGAAMGFLSELGGIAVASNPRVSKAAFVRCALTSSAAPCVQATPAFVRRPWTGCCSGPARAFSGVMM